MQSGSKRRPRNLGQQILGRVRRSQARIAREIGVNQSTVSAWLRGVYLPGDVHRAALEHRYEIPVDAWDQSPTGRGNLPTVWAPPSERKRKGRKRKHFPVVAALVRVEPGSGRQRGNADEFGPPLAIAHGGSSGGAERATETVGTTPTWTPPTGLTLGLERPPKVAIAHGGSSGGAERATEAIGTTPTWTPPTGLTLDLERPPKTVRSVHISMSAEEQ
jgi:hypothetical protein